MLVPVADPALAVAAVADARKLLTLALTLLPSPPSSELSELATEPVAVARTELRDEAREPASLVTEAMSDDSSERWEEMPLATALPACEAESESSEAIELAAEPASLRAEDTADSAEERAPVTLLMMPPG